MSMVLADTSVWIDHFRHRDEELARLLEAGLLVMHPFIIGELACGSLAHRGEVLYMLAQLPAVTQATHNEALTLLDQRKIMGTGLGWIDVNLLASSLISGCQLWTRDTRLHTAARNLEQSPFARGA